MSEWSIIRFTEARQVATLAGHDEDSLPEADVSVRAHYDKVRAEEGGAYAALEFIGVALPRLEAINWAAHILDAESRNRELKLRDRQTLDYCLRWLGDPNDANRRAAHESAQAASPRGPERLLGFAVFYSGGSISTPDLPPVLPPPEAAARFAVGAIATAAYRTDAPEALFDRALVLAEAVASKGIGALS
jgi:hypothetical protein